MLIKTNAHVLAEQSRALQLARRTANGACWANATALVLDQPRIDGVPAVYVEGWLVETNTCWAHAWVELGARILELTPDLFDVQAGQFLPATYIAARHWAAQDVAALKRRRLPAALGTPPWVAARAFAVSVASANVRKLGHPVTTISARYVDTATGIAYDGNWPMT